MDFNLNENQTMFRDMVRDFARQHIAPIAHRMDVEGRMPDELIAALREAGFFGLTFPEAYGGLGVDTLTYGLVVEELSKASAGVSARKFAVVLPAHESYQPPTRYTGMSL